MIRVEIPGRARPLEICHVVLDYNGTIAVGGVLLPEAASRAAELRRAVKLHILTADTYGTVREQCAALGAVVHTFPRAGAGERKKEIVRGLEGGAACFGNGYNDIPMFGEAALSVAVLEGEGVCAALLPHADILVRSAAEGLDLLLNPDRIRAALRN